MKDVSAAASTSAISISNDNDFLIDLFIIHYGRKHSWIRSRTEIRISPRHFPSELERHLIAPDKVTNPINPLYEIARRRYRDR